MGESLSRSNIRSHYTQNGRKINFWHNLTNNPNQAVRGGEAQIESLQVLISSQREGGTDNPLVQCTPPPSYCAGGTVAKTSKKSKAIKAREISKVEVHLFGCTQKHLNGCCRAEPINIEITVLAYLVGSLIVSIKLTEELFLNPI